MTDPQTDAQFVAEMAKERMVKTGNGFAVSQERWDRLVILAAQPTRRLPSILHGSHDWTLSAYAPGFGDVSHCQRCDIHSFEHDAGEACPITAELLAAPTWQPIETAPKDGTRVLIFDPAVGIRAALWEAEFEHVYTEENPDEPQPRGAWTDHAVRSFGYEEVNEYSPTRWMPLPAAPAPEREP